MPLNLRQTLSPWAWRLGISATLLTTIGLAWVCWGLPGDPMASPETRALQEAAREYRRALPGAFRTVAGQVRSGQVRDINRTIGAIEALRDPARDRLGEALDHAVRSRSDAAGNFRDAEGVADTLEAVARVLEGR